MQSHEGPDGGLLQTFNTVLSWMRPRAAGSEPAGACPAGQPVRDRRSGLIDKTQADFAQWWPDMLPQERIHVVDAVVSVFCQSRARPGFKYEELASANLRESVGFHVEGPSETELERAEHLALASAAASGIRHAPFAFEQVEASLQVIRQTCALYDAHWTETLDVWRQRLLAPVGGITRRKLARAGPSLEGILDRLRAVADSIRSHQLQRPVLPSSDEILLDAFHATQSPQDRFEAIIEFLIDLFDLHLVSRPGVGGTRQAQAVERQVQDQLKMARALEKAENAYPLHLEAIFQKVRSLQAQGHKDLERLAVALVQLEGDLRLEGSPASQYEGLPHFATLPIEQQLSAVDVTHKSVFRACEEYAERGRLSAPGPFLASLFAAMTSTHFDPVSSPAAERPVFWTFSPPPQRAPVWPPPSRLVPSSSGLNPYPPPPGLFSREPQQSPYAPSSHYEQHALPQHPPASLHHPSTTTPYPHPHPHTHPHLPGHPDAHGPYSLAHDAPRPRISPHYARRYYGTTAAEWEAGRAWM